MYMSETAPRQIRGAMVSTYQLFITLGILVANLINFGTHTNTTAFSWRLPMGIGFIWPAIMALGICFLRESPRWEYRRGKIDSARTTIAKSYGVAENHWEVDREIREIQAKLDAENAGGGKHPFYEVFTGPRMMYRVALGVSMQALQQLTGANYFFYYGMSSTKEEILAIVLTDLQARPFSPLPAWTTRSSRPSSLALSTSA